MKSNKLRIRIKKPVDQVFKFTITPPNSTLWIKSVIKEETNQWPVQVGTVYKLYDKNGKCFEVVATVLKENDMVEWVSKDHVYHCRYSFKSLDKNTTEFEYYEWVDKGELKAPFNLAMLEKLRSVIEEF